MATRVPHRRLRSARGFTLVEMVVALAIFLVILAVGWGSMRSHLPRFRMVRAAKGLQADLMTLRNIAIDTNRETRLVLVDSPGSCSANADAWGGGWQLEVGDLSSGSTSWELLPLDAWDGSDDDQTEGVADLNDGGNREARGVCLEDWGTLEGPGSGNEDAVVFDPRGWVENPGTDFDSSGYVHIRLRNQDATRKGIEDVVTVRISRAGMVRLESTLGDTIPSHTVGTGRSSSAP